MLSFLLGGIFCVYEKPDGSNRAEREKKLKKMGAIEYSRIYAFGMEYLRSANIVAMTAQTRRIHLRVILIPTSHLYLFTCGNILFKIWCVCQGFCNGVLNVTKCL